MLSDPIGVEIPGHSRRSWRPFCFFRLGKGGRGCTVLESSAGSAREIKSAASAKMMSALITIICFYPHTCNMCLQNFNSGSWVRLFKWPSPHTSADPHVFTLLTTCPGEHCSPQLGCSFSSSSIRGPWINNRRVKRSSISEAEVEQ